MANVNNISKYTLTVAPEDLAAVIGILTQQQITYLVSQNNNGESVIEMDLTDEQSSALSNAFIRYNIKTSIVKFANIATGAVISGTEYIAKDVIIPVGKLGLKVGAAAGRIAVESTVIAGASAINVITEQSKLTKEVIQSSDEYQQAKASLKEGASKLKSLFGFKGSSFNLTRI